MKSLELRKKFFDFFVARGHEKVASSSLIPAQDPTILFTNAGMNQFKDLFLGLEQRSYKRAVSIQKCVRAGGKHNDLENVGFTQRHLTFFEMMGNFSFGDYFKKEAIEYAWEFLTKDIGLDVNKLYVSVHFTDQESYDIWHEVMGVAKEKIFKLGESNFWQMGDVGPCGPCTEIFVDRGPNYGCGKKECDLACGCDRFMEVWNNVFMQFNRQADGTDIPLKQTGVDTGMGLERLCTIVQNKDSVFATDLFLSVFKKIEELTGYEYDTASDEIKASFNVLGDHVRSSTFLIADGCAPSNEGRGYVLRKIIRRAALFAQKLTDQNIFPQVALVLIDEMKTVYPELMTSRDLVVSVLTSEIERFSENLVRGKRILQEYMIKYPSIKIIDGAHAFMLYDTYGFPLEVTKLIAFEHNRTVDEIGFEQHMQEQRERSGKKMKEAAYTVALSQDVVTEFTGYQSLYESSEVTAILLDDVLVDSVDSKTECWIITRKSPFYVACGGQVNDQGSVIIEGKETELLDLKKMGDAICMKIVAPVHLMVGQVVELQVNQFVRFHTMKNHTATHLLQAALQRLFGKTVKQAGSVVNSEYLRFDFTYHKPLTLEEIEAVEDLVNEKIWENISVNITNTTYKNAVSQGVIAFFGDKYNPDNVRVIQVGDFSAELCGGTHVRATGDIGTFKIIEEIALAAGQRRMVAVTGFKALELFQQDFNIVKKMSQDFKVKADQLFISVQNLQQKIKDQQKEISLVRAALIKFQISQWLQSVEMVRAVPILVFDARGYSAEDMRLICQELQKQKPGFYFLIANQEDKSVFVASVDKAFVEEIVFAELKPWLSSEFGLQGGGNNLVMQGGGSVINITEFKKKLISFIL
ncbi:alanine--tRNA ligase [Candidatus Dependentiae bacterium]|nr:alanine--tRNA ligase [Candidatus Dependentiae bacterium]